MVQVKVTRLVRVCALPSVTATVTFCGVPGCGALIDTFAVPQPLAYCAVTEYW